MCIRDRGDSVVAALAYAESQDMSEEDAVRLSTATGAANVMCSGTQAAERSVIEELLHMTFAAPVAVERRTASSSLISCEDVYKRQSHCRIRRLKCRKKLVFSCKSS